MLGGAEAGGWCDAARNAAMRLGLDLDAYCVDGVLEPDGRFAEIYGISPSGGVLVRPDGFIGWRSRSAEPAPEKTLTRVLSSILRVDAKTRAQ
jgi:putative polyketide hydroxylase